MPARPQADKHVKHAENWKSKTCQAKACLSSKEKVIETFNITELIKVASQVSLTRCVQRETCTQKKKKTPVARRLQAWPENQKQTEVRAIQFPQPVSPRGPAVQSNKSLAKRPSAELSGVATRLLLFLSWPPSWL